MTGGKWLLLIKVSATWPSQTEERAGRSCEDRPWRAAYDLASCNNGGDVEQAERANVCANKTRRPEEVRTEACLPPGRLLFCKGQDGRDECWVMRDHLRGPSIGTHAGLASPKLHQGRKCQGGRNLVWANRERTFEVPLVCQKPSPRP